MNQFEQISFVRKPEGATKSKVEQTKSPEKRKERVLELGQERRGDLAKRLLTSEVVNNGLDVLPFAGSGKMMVEAVYGSTLAGKELTGKDRIIHGAMGAGMLALDFTGIGEAGRVLKLGGKTLPLVEKIGAKLAGKGAIKGAAIFAKTGEFMARHPDLVAKAEKLAEARLRQHMSKFQTSA